MSDIPPRLAIAELCVRLGVKFITHKEAAIKHVSNLAAWAPLFGYKNYSKSVYVTMRPYIIHPDQVEDPLDDWRIIAHELVHWQRQPDSKWGLYKWIIRYGVCQKFRAVEEMHAHLEDIHNQRLPNDIPHVVENMREWYKLSNVDPAWMVDWMEARL